MTQKKKTTTKKKPKNKPIIHHISLWKVLVHYFIGWPEDQVQAYTQDMYDWQKSNIEKCGAYCAEMHGPQGEFHIIIWTRDKNITSYLAHECVHAANMIMSARGYWPEQNNDEPQAYLVEELMRVGLNEGKEN